MHITFTFLTPFLYFYIKPDGGLQNMQLMSNNILSDNKYCYVRWWTVSKHRNG